MPGSFDFEDHDTGAACAGTGSTFDAVSRLGNLWRRMQVRRWCGQDQPFVRFGFSSYLELIYVYRYSYWLYLFFFLLDLARFSLVVS
jgi:hypothetical protein